MTAGLIKDLPSLKPLKRVSPSRYTQLRACALREIWTAGGSPRLLPRNPATILGTIAHDLLEEAAHRHLVDIYHPLGRWGELAEIANQALKHSWLEASLYPLEKSAKMYEVLKIRACARADQVSSAKQTASFSKPVRGTGFEVWVESQDKIVGGWIDSARMVKGGIVLSDFKSGDVLERPQGIQQSQLKESHTVQLKLYAALYFETYKTWPIAIQVVPLSGARLDVPFTDEECGSLLEQASLVFRETNSRISAQSPSDYDSFANPSPSNCRFCAYRPACPRYRTEGRFNDAKSDWPADTFGKVWDINVLRNGQVNLRVSGDRGKGFTLRALSSDSNRHPALQMIQRGDQVGIFSARASTDRTEFAEGTLTTLYKLTI